MKYEYKYYRDRQAIIKDQNLTFFPALLYQLLVFFYAFSFATYTIDTDSYQNVEKLKKVIYRYSLAELFKIQRLTFNRDLPYELAHPEGDPPLPFIGVNAVTAT